MDVSIHGGTPKIDGLYWKILLKWMNWWYSHFRTHQNAYICFGRWEFDIFQCVRLEGHPGVTSRQAEREAQEEKTLVGNQTWFAGKSLIDVGDVPKSQLLPARKKKHLDSTDGDIFMDFLHCRHSCLIAGV